MGQIVIDIPTNTKRHYVLTDKARTTELLTDLDASAIRVTTESLSIEEMEYIEDVKDVEEAMVEYRRTGITHRWEDIEAEIGV